MLPLSLYEWPYFLFYLFLYYHASIITFSFFFFLIKEKGWGGETNVATPSGRTIRAPNPLEECSIQGWQRKSAQPPPHHSEFHPKGWLHHMGEYVTPSPTKTVYGTNPKGSVAVPTQDPGPRKFPGFNRVNRSIMSRTRDLVMMNETPFHLHHNLGGCNGLFSIEQNHMGWAL